MKLTVDGAHARGAPNWDGRNKKMVGEKDVKSRNVPTVFFLTSVVFPLCLVLPQWDAIKAIIRKEKGFLKREIVA